MRITVHATVDVSDAEADALRDLSGAVYPPETSTGWPGRALEWAPAAWCVVCWDEDGRALSHVGMVLRECRVDGRSVKVGGIGGVKTHPDARGGGLATRAIARAVAFFSEHEVEFALLVCEPGLVPFYERLDWRPYPGALLVSQWGETTRFTFNLPMIHPVDTSGPTGGEIDLQGPPW